MSAGSKRADALRAITKRADTSTPPPGQTAMRTQPMRLTVDLDPALWTDLQGWIAQVQAARRGKITSAAVVRELIDLMVTDQETSATVRNRLQ